eukprot:6206307-Pleurochrysis_carterae.AAC.1
MACMRLPAQVSRAVREHPPAERVACERTAEPRAQKFHGRTIAGKQASEVLHVRNTRRLQRVQRNVVPSCEEYFCCGCAELVRGKLGH